jgi:hypothetical protein
LLIQAQQGNKGSGIKAISKDRPDLEPLDYIINPIYGKEAELRRARALPANRPAGFTFTGPAPPKKFSGSRIAAVSRDIFRPGRADLEVIRHNPLYGKDLSKIQPSLHIPPKRYAFLRQSPGQTRNSV